MFPKRVFLVQNGTKLKKVNITIEFCLFHKGSCHNSKTSNHIDIKLEPVTKLENKTGNAKKI